MFNDELKMDKKLFAMKIERERSKRIKLLYVPLSVYLIRRIFSRRAVCRTKKKNDGKGIRGIDGYSQ